MGIKTFFKNAFDDMKQSTKTYRTAQKTWCPEIFCKI